MLKYFDVIQSKKHKMKHFDNTRVDNGQTSGFLQCSYIYLNAHQSKLKQKLQLRFALMEPDGPALFVISNI